METEKNKSRRRFLRNSALASLSLGIVTTETNAKPDVLETESCNPTTLDYYGQGPFYTANAPVISSNQLAGANELGTRLILSGIVKTLDCTQVIPNTLIDIWHANDAGQYDNTGFKLRGRTYSNAQGFYTIETILPGKYLNGAIYRPSHIHFKITPPSFPSVITQIYFQGDSDIPADAAASITSGPYDASQRIIPLSTNSQGKYEGIWDIGINGNGTVGVADMHVNKGLIYSIFPNPFVDQIEIHYGVFQASKVSIQLFDMNGSQVAKLEEQNLAPEKYKAILKPEKPLPAGIYFATLKVNDLQVHYQRIMKL
jgi:protocatechuate 3,4-dioxygenase beta subunit